jgi:hypothetical protein
MVTNTRLWLFVRCEGAALLECLPVEVEMKCGAGECAIELQAQEDGTYIGRYTTSVAGFYRLYVSSCGKPLGNSPYSIKVPMSL